MSLWGFLKAAGRGTEAPTPARDRVPSRVLRAVNQLTATRYDAAEPGGPNERHWSPAGSISARQANSPGVRETLRNRGRYEVANNCLARGVVDTLADDTIGAGPTLQVLEMSRQDAARLEWAWYDWCDAVDLWGKMRLARKARGVDGEIFIVRATNERLENPVKLDLQLVEAERVADPRAVDLEPRKVDGIEYDDRNNPTRYRVLRHHPDDDAYTRDADAADFIDARDVIHYFRAERAGQVRGIPEITAALPLFAHLRRFELAVVQAAEAAANHAMVLQTTNPVDGGASGYDPEPMDEFELPSGVATALPDGWQLGGFKAEQPTTTFGDFRRQIANEIGRCLSMPLNVVLCDSSQSNFSSAKLDHVIYDRKLKVDRDELRIRALDRIFRWWLAEAVLVSGLLPQSARRRIPPVRVSWTWPAWEHADPAKEAAGVKGRLEARTSNLKIECARNGHDWQEVLEGQAEEAKFAKQLGLPDPYAKSPAPAPAAKPAGQPAGDADDPEDPDKPGEGDDED